MPNSPHSTPAPPDPNHLIAQALDGFAELDRIFTILTNLIDPRGIGYQLARDGSRLAARHRTAMQILQAGALTDRRRAPRCPRIGGRHV
ncbi:hypothetical protein [Andreprevotia chitinilytica]|uniref:hypothetical protein n=1 Tax=Andreprevotia chitinilytica TaxID=396808 RepID=UPI00054FB950|nr:hypothetical protein [Andreprevotia chitinilytica]